jgi:L-malate glycosyltransferase
MKILHTVEYYHPSVGGMQEVVKQLSERLVENGHKVTVATKKLENRGTPFINGVQLEEFDVSGNSVVGITGEVERYQRFLLNSDFDVITNFAAQQWATDLMLPILDNIPAKKVFVPTGFSGLGSPHYKDYFENMIIWMKKYNVNVFLSNDYRDINFARDHQIGNLYLIPNGADEKEFLFDNNIDIRGMFNIPNDDFLILHVGSHTGVKGHKEAIEIFKNVKIKNTTLLVVGNYFKEFNNNCANECKKQEFLYKFSPQRILNKKRLIITSLDRQKTVSAYKQANLFLFPSNIECSPLVLFECMASKTPFLSTDVGNAAEIMKWSNSGMLLPSIQEANGNTRANVSLSARILEELYFDRDKLYTMAEAGFDAWINNYTWQKITQQYEQMYFKLISCNK